MFARNEALSAYVDTTDGKKNSRGKGPTRAGLTSHDFMADDYTHVNYEHLKEALGKETSVNLSDGIVMMELLNAFKQHKRCERDSRNRMTRRYLGQSPLGHDPDTKVTWTVDTTRM